MAASVSAVYNFRVDVTEVIGVSFDNASDPDTLHQITGVSGTLNASSTVPATKVYCAQEALVAGALTLDLTALSVAFLASAIDFTNLKVQIIQIKATSSNAGDLAVVPGAMNPYDFLGAATDQITLKPGAIQTFYAPNNIEDVDATHKEIDFSGTGTDTFDILLVAG